MPDGELGAAANLALTSCPHPDVGRGRDGVRAAAQRHGVRPFPERDGRGGGHRHVGRDCNTRSSNRVANPFEMQKGLWMIRKNDIFILLSIFIWPDSQCGRRNLVMVGNYSVGFKDLDSCVVVK